MGYRPLLVLAVSALLLSGCTAVQAPGAESPAATSEPIVTAEPIAVPQPVLAGDCSLLLAPAAAAAVAGAPVELIDTPFRFDVSYAAITQLGGIDCAWESDGAGLGVIVVPDAAVDAGVPEEVPCGDSEYCAISDVSAGFRLTGYLLSDGAATEKTAGLELLRAAFRSAVAAETPALPYAPDGAWAMPVDCAGLDGSHALGAALGDPSLVGESTVLNEPDPNSGFSAALESAPVATCVWLAPGEDTWIVVRMLSGGAWVEDALVSAPGAERVRIPGVDNAVLLDGSLSVFAGVNRLTLEVRSSGGGPQLDSLVPAAGAITAELDARK